MNTALMFAACQATPQSSVPVQLMSPGGQIAAPQEEAREHSNVSAGPQQITQVGPASDPANALPPQLIWLGVGSAAALLLMLAAYGILHRNGRVSAQRLAEECAAYTRAHNR